MRQSPVDSDPAPKADDNRPVFASILCGVDGRRCGLEAARQAAVLVADGAKLSLLAVTWETGTGPTATAALSRGGRSKGSSARASLRASGCPRGCRGGRRTRCERAAVRRRARP